MGRCVCTKAPVLGARGEHGRGRRGQEEVWKGGDGKVTRGTGEGEREGERRGEATGEGERVGGLRGEARRWETWRGERGEMGEGVREGPRGMARGVE